MLESRSLCLPGRSHYRLRTVMFIWRRRMDLTTLLEPEKYLSGSFGGTHQNLCPTISGILRAHLHVLLERVNYYTVLLHCSKVLGGRLLLFRKKNMKVMGHLWNELVMKGSIVAGITPSWRYRDHSLIIYSIHWWFSWWELNVCFNVSLNFHLPICKWAIEWDWMLMSKSSWTFGWSEQIAIPMYSAQMCTFLRVAGF